MSLYKSNGIDLDTIFALTHAGWPAAPACGYKEAGSDLNTRYAKLSTGTAVGANVGYRDSTGHDLITYFAAAGTTGVVVATQPGNVAGSSAAGSPSGTITSNTTTCAGSKGSGNYTYQWYFVGSAEGCVFTHPTSATTAVSGDVNALITLSGQMYCQISDGVTNANTHNANWSLQNTSTIQHLYTAGDSGTETSPCNGYVTTEAAGGGGGGEGGYFDTSTHQSYGGTGGTSGSYCRSKYAISIGQTLEFAVGAGGPGGAGGDYGAPGAGGTSTVLSGTLTITTMSAFGGDTGYTPTGGNQANIDGNPGTVGGLDSAGQGGPAVAGEYASGGPGGNGGLGPGNGVAGQGGIISFYYSLS